MIVNLCGANDVCEATGYDAATWGDDLENLAPAADAYREAAGLPALIVVIYGWEHFGVWAGGGYFPPKPSAAAFLAARDALERQGDRSAILISGYWFVKKRNATRYGPAFDNSEAWAAAAPGLVVRADGASAAERGLKDAGPESIGCCHVDTPPPRRGNGSDEDPRL